MTITVPNATNYQSPLNAVPTKYNKTPSEGAKIVDCEVDWGTMGGENNAVYFNLQNNATLNFSQIVALSIDNSQCGADIQFIFPDTSSTLPIPAYTPQAVVPVFTNQTQFYLTSPNARSEDVTRFGILNTLPPPVTVPTTQEQNSSSNNNVNGGANGTTSLVASTVSGTLENTNVGWWSGSLASSTWSLQDGTGKVLFSGQGVGGNSNPSPGEGGSGFLALLNSSDTRLRFQNGLNFVVTGSSAGGVQQTYVVNLLYRTP